MLSKKILKSSLVTFSVTSNVIELPPNSAENRFKLVNLGLSGKGLPPQDFTDFIRILTKRHQGWLGLNGFL